MTDTTIERLSYSDMRVLVTLSFEYPADVRAAALAQLARDEQAGLPDPPGFAALMEACGGQP